MSFGDENVLTRLERTQIRLVKRTFDSPALSRSVRWLQLNVGQRWIHLVTSRLHHIHGLERVPRYAAHESFIVASNHRSFFDLYVVVATLVREGYPQRIMFPVRSTFFYDHPLGLVVNGAMSFFAMYPPIFRDRKKATLNASSVEEVAKHLRGGGHLVGFHPEGTRNQGNPYQLLPMRTGIGRLVHLSQVPVVPVFTNGLRVDDLPAQIRGNFNGTGTPIHTVFGEPLTADGRLGTLLQQPGTQSTYKQIANLIGEAIAALGTEERELRAAAGHAPFAEPG